ncbi:peptidoglycan-binding protein [Nesterenkonia sp. YGD6]|nr:peptidoglycan-binding protein [Nesterenkonia sp. YGD6]
MTVVVNGSAPERLLLQPVFPGFLTFKPASSQTIPADPRSGAAPIVGDLYLELAPRAVEELGKAEETFGYALTFVYYQVALSGAFLATTIVDALKATGGAGFVRVIENSTTLRTPAQLTNAFARGAIGVNLRPAMVAAGVTFPILVPAGSGNGQATLQLGVRTMTNPYTAPPSIVSAAGPTITAAPEFVAFPIPLFYRLLRTLPQWSRIAAGSGHASHAFYDALDALEDPVTNGYWRRLRVFLPGPRPKTAVAVKAFDALTFRARTTAGAPLWSAPVNRVGEVFVRQTDGLGCRIDVTTPTETVLVSAAPDGPKVAQLDVQWPPLDATGKPTLLDLTAHVATVGDPLTVDPPIPLRLGTRDQAGLTLNPKAKAVVAERELVRPLQRALVDFGFGTVEAVTGIFDARTEGLVRAFQRDARTTQRRDAVGLADPATVTPWTGAVNGQADVPTLQEMLHWRSQAYRTVNSDQLWAVEHQWTDIMTGTTTYATHYSTWVSANVDRFNDTEYLCNWFPLRLLVEYASMHGLRLRLRYWQGSAPTDPRLRENRSWDYSTVLTHHSHDGSFNSKSAYYFKIRSTVTARMIGELNTAAVSRGQAQPGDLVALDYGRYYWHMQQIVAVTGSRVSVQDGSTPKQIPRANKSDLTAIPAKAYGGGYRRWRFGDFD